MDGKAEEKKDRLLTALEKGMVMIHLDARRPGVVVPEQLREEAHLRLNLSYRFDPPDLSVGEWGVRSTLSFSGRRFTIAVPWNALFAITSHVSREFWMYPDEMPPELLQNPLATAQAEQREDDPPRPAAKPRAVLRDVSMDSPLREVPKPVAAVEVPPPPPVPVPGKDDRGPDDEPPRRGHLRIVK